MISDRCLNVTIYLMVPEQFTTSQYMNLKCRQNLTNISEEVTTYKQ